MGKYERCQHCDKLGTPESPIEPDRDDNWLCQECRIIEQQAQEDEAVFD